MSNAPAVGPGGMGANGTGMPSATGAGASPAANAGNTASGMGSTTNTAMIASYTGTAADKAAFALSTIVAIAFGCLAWLL